VTNKIKISNTAFYLESKTLTHISGTQHFIICHYTGNTPYTDYRQIWEGNKKCNQIIKILCTCLIIKVKAIQLQAWTGP
jgi:hypothetical protein